MMFDILRKQIFRASLKLTSVQAREISFFETHEHDTTDQLFSIQEQKLGKLLNHIARNVPFYRHNHQEILIKSNIRSYEQLKELPIITKEQLRVEPKLFISDDLLKRNWYHNKTGGSTGEPLQLIQETADSSVTGGATLRWFYGWHDILPGDREIKLWGSDRDLFYGAPPLSKRLKRYFYGYRILNAFNMSLNDMKRYIDEINQFRPSIIRGYCTNLYELAKFIEENSLHIFSPRVVVSSAGKLYPHMREKMETVYKCPVIDHYGTREVHNVAMECRAQRGLHINPFTHVVEIVDDQGNSCNAGQEGRIIITTLLNYAMPLVRYDIGDRGVAAQGKCLCGRSLPRLETITGRSTDCFRTKEGKLIPGEFFIFLLVVEMKNYPYQQVQVIQKTYDHIVIRLVLKNSQQLSDTMRREIIEKTRVVMGAGCEVEFEFVDKIPESTSGKYRYTICEFAEKIGTTKVPESSAFRY